MTVFTSNISEANLNGDITLNNLTVHTGGVKITGGTKASVGLGFYGDVGSSVGIHEVFGNLSRTGGPIYGHRLEILDATITGAPTEFISYDGILHSGLNTDFTSYISSGHSLTGAVPLYKGFACVGGGLANVTQGIGFYSNVMNQAGTERFNFYAHGDAPSYFGGITQHEAGIKLTGKSADANIMRGGDALGLRLRPPTLSRAGGQIVGTQISPADSITIDSNQLYINCFSDNNTTVACSQSIGFQSNIASVTNATKAIGFQAVVQSTSVGQNFYGFHTSYSGGMPSISGNSYAFYGEGTASSRFNGRIFPTAGVCGNPSAENVLRPGMTYGKYGFGLQVAAGTGGVCSFARNGGGGPVIEIKQAAASDLHIQFNTEASGAVRNIGNIRNNINEDGIIFYAGGTTSTSAAYTVASDRRLKSNIVDAPSAVDLVKALQPRKYDLAISKNVLGFIADELQLVVPEAVVGTPNAELTIGTLADYDGTVLETAVVEPEELEYTEEVETDGVSTATIRTRIWTATGTEPVYQGVDHTKLIPLLTKALQETIAENEAVQADVDANEVSRKDVIEFESNLTQVKNSLRSTYINIGNNIELVPAAAGGRVEITGDLVLDASDLTDAADDTAAAAANVVVGGVYHNNGVLRVRLS